MTVEGLRRDYTVALMRFLPAGDEGALSAGYEMGRRCLEADVSILDIVRVHHDALAGILAGTRPEEHPGVVGAAGDFLAELLTSVDLVRRAMTENADTADHEV